VTVLVTTLALFAADVSPAPVQLGLVDRTRYVSYVCGPRCRERRRWRRVVRPYRPWLARVASCESGGRWHIATGNGFYGGVQFTASSWRAVGGRGLPHWASRLEQSYRAVRLLHLQGAGAWPVCGR